MKQFLFTAISIMTALVLFAQPRGSQLSLIGLEPITLDDFNFKGPVKMLKSESYNSLGGSEFMDGSKFTYYFDAKGRITELYRKIDYMGMDLGSMTDKYIYDNTGRLTAIESKDEDQKISNSKFTYDAKGNLLSVESTIVGNPAKITCEYDASNRIVTKKEFYANQALPYKILTFTYDGYGRITSVTDENVSKKEKEKKIYTYREGISYFDTEKLENGAENPVTGIATTQLQYNEKGDVDYRNCLDSKGEHTRFSSYYTYEYDKMGNYTLQNTRGSDEGYVIQTIQYHGEPDANSPQGIYRKAIMEGIDPSLKEIGFLFQSAIQKTLSKEQLLKNLTHLATTIAADKKYVLEIKEIQGNNAKDLALEVLNYMGSAQVQADLQKLVNDPDKNAHLVGIIGEQVATKIGLINTELGKL